MADGRDFLRAYAGQIITGEAVASQLPGRAVGPADVYRHLLLAAELTREFGTLLAFQKLLEHEIERGSGADNGLDFWNNEIGIRIGEYVAAQDGDWFDVVRLCRQVMVESFGTEGYEAVGSWDAHDADDGIRLAYERIQSVAPIGLPTAMIGFDGFASYFDRTYDFRVAPGGEISLEGGALTVPRVAITSSQNWDRHPEVDGVEITIDQSTYPTQAWANGEGFVYEPGNWAERYGELLREPRPQRNLGRPRDEALPRTRPMDIGHDRTEVPASDRSSTDGSSTPSRAEGKSALSAIPSFSADSKHEGGGFVDLLSGHDGTQFESLLTVPGDRMSAAQRSALMAEPAFSDADDPLFGAAVAKYRETNAAGTARAAEQGAVGLFGRVAQPVFAETDGAPADADGRPMADAQRALGGRINAVAEAMGQPAAVGSLQRALNRLGDDQVAADTPKDGSQARRKLPKLLVDGVLGPKTKQAARLALHQWGAGAVAGTLEDADRRGLG